mmetsp:Transcript_10049/g.10853  ORF Transcript_10049/g.10853 Transcript_10049/m.10853 type:complete len:589 (-) Transcript_10049:180-1946(-)
MTASYQLITSATPRDDPLPGPSSSEKNIENETSIASSNPNSVEPMLSSSTTNIVSPSTTFKTNENKSETISVSSKRFQDDEIGVDSDYAWVIDIACFFVQFFVVGNVFSFGVFLPTYIDVFNSNQATASWIGSIGSFLMVFLGVFTGALDDRFGNQRIIFIGSILIVIGFILASFATELWHLYLTHGLIAGFGYSACFISSVGIVGQWFKKKRGLAVGVAIAGSGIGQFGMAQVIGVLLDTVGWRQTLRYLALINGAGLMICSFLIRRRLPCARRLFNFQNLKEFFSNANFMFLSWGYMIFAFGMLIPNGYLVIYSKKHGLSQTKAVLLLSVMGITNGIGRVVVGQIADQSFGRLNLLKLSMICAGICTLCWLTCKDFSSLLAFSLIYGFVGGGAVSLVPSIAADILGVRKISSFTGVMYTISSIANLSSTPIAGFMSDKYDTYTPAIILSGCCQMCAVLLLIFMRLNIYIESSRKLKNSGKSDDSDMVSSSIPSKPRTDTLKSQHPQASTRKIIQNGNGEEEIVLDFPDVEEGVSGENKEEIEMCSRDLTLNDSTIEPESSKSDKDVIADDLIEPVDLADQTSLSKV